MLLMMTMKKENDTVDDNWCCLFYTYIQGKLSYKIFCPKWCDIKQHIQGYYKRNRHFQRYVVSPDLTPCDFLLWGYMKDRVFIPPLPVSLNELKQRITTAVASVDEDMLRSVWTESDYHIDICRVTKGSHIEHL